MSIRRQLERGEKTAEQNSKIAESGVGDKEVIRPTDLDPELAFSLQ